MFFDEIYSPLLVPALFSPREQAQRSPMSNIDMAKSVEGTNEVLHRLRLSFALCLQVGGAVTGSLIQW